MKVLHCDGRNAGGEGKLQRGGEKKQQNHHVLRSRNRKFQTLRRARYDSCRVMCFLILLF